MFTRIATGILGCLIGAAPLGAGLAAAGPTPVVKGMSRCSVQVTKNPRGDSFPMWEWVDPAPYTTQQVTHTTAFIKPGKYDVEALCWTADGDLAGISPNVTTIEIPTPLPTKIGPISPLPSMQTVPKGRIVLPPPPNTAPVQRPRLGVDPGRVAPAAR